MYSLTEENYLKAIYKLYEHREDNVNTNAIASMMNTKAASVTDMLKKLAAKKLLKYEKYKGVALTEKGRKVALEIVRKHRLWETFLFEKLKFGWDEVHDVAEQLEHIQSEYLMDKLDEFLGRPKHDPHGDPIPDKSGKMRSSDFQLLSSLEPGKTGVMSGVVDHGKLFLQHLNKLNISIGKNFSVLEVNEYDGALKLKMDNIKQMEMSRDVAKNILVQVK